LIEQADFNLVRFSELKNDPDRVVDYAGKPKSETIILGDTMGDLRKFYSLAKIIFVGRSLVPMGGSDVAEAAALGKCTIFGPHTFNFNQTVDDLLSADGAIVVDDGDELFEAVRRCLTDSDYAEKIARKGRATVIKNQGATKRTVDKIETLLNRK